MIIKESVDFQKYWMDPSGKLYKCKDHNEFALKNIVKYISLSYKI